MSAPVKMGGGAPSPLPVDVGDVIAGKYQVERVIGLGGMGVVVAARHVALGERVAIKFLLPTALAREDVVTRFRREGQAAARLKSEHVTRVLDVGELPSGAPFLVMEYLDGIDLGALVQQKGTLPVEESVGHLLQACEALAEAHSLGIIHRDLKPSNLFVVKRLDGSPSVKLIDFGISKIQLPEAGEEGSMTATAVMMGSPYFMAPEQMASARDVDGRADIWSLGILLHNVLAGQPPFRAPTVMGVYEKIVAGAPPVRRERPDVPEGLEAVILKCLRKNRAERYAHVGELAEALAPFGPPGSEAAAERVKRIVAARRTQSAPPPPDVAVPVASLTRAGTRPATGAGLATGSVPADPTRLSASGASVVEGGGTAGPWDQRTPPPSGRRRSLAFVAIGVVTVMLVAPISFLVMQEKAGPAPSAHAASAHAGSASAPPSSSATTVAAAPADSAPAVVPASATAEPTASASAAPPASASVAPPASASSRPRAPAGQPGSKPTGAPKGKSPDELFATQK